MNYLAHCLIGASARATEEDAALVAGGFLGDFIKGRVPAEMPEPLALGVRLHRRVDAYSNQLPGIKVSCDRFPTELRRIAPILVDIVCDHLLSLRWQEFHAQPIHTFTARTYSQIDDHSEWLSDPGQRFLDYARENDLLARYHDWNVVMRAMHSITRRLGREDLNPQLDRDVAVLLDDLDGDFRSYFPEILEHAREWVATP